MFAITFKMMTRRAVANLMLALLAVGGTLGMLIMGGLTDSQYAALENAYDETEIKVVLSNARGNATEGIALPKLIYDKLSQKPLSEHIERVALRCTPIFNTYVDREIEAAEEDMEAEKEGAIMCKIKR